MGGWVAQMMSLQSADDNEPLAADVEHDRLSNSPLDTLSNGQCQWTRDCNRCTSALMHIQSISDFNIYSVMAEPVYLGHACNGLNI